jgi:hypothetical protein
VLVAVGVEMLKGVSDSLGRVSTEKFILFIAFFKHPPAQLVEETPTHGTPGAFHQAKRTFGSRATTEQQVLFLEGSAGRFVSPLRNDRGAVVAAGQESAVGPVGQEYVGKKVEE